MLIRMFATLPTLGFRFVGMRRLLMRRRWISHLLSTPLRADFMSRLARCTDQSVVTSNLQIFAGVCVLPSFRASAGVVGTTKLVKYIQGTSCAWRLHPPSQYPIELTYRHICDYIKALCTKRARRSRTHPALPLSCASWISKLAACISS